MKKIFAFMIVGLLCSCSSSSLEVLNPYGTDNTEYTSYGKRDNSAILGNSGGRSSGQSENARHALEVIGTYRAAQDPQPYYPVMQPAEVRLMWVPDHLNKSGDLVPAHYFYLKVLDDRWAVQDAFEIEKQLSTDNDGTATPWVYGNQK